MTALGRSIGSWDQPAQGVALAGWLVLALTAPLLQSCSPSGLMAVEHPSIEMALQTALAGAEPELTELYSERRFRPLWLRGLAFAPEARQLAIVLGDADRQRLDPARYAVAKAMADADGSGQPAAFARAELSLTRAFAAYVRDLRSPPPGTGFAFVDPGVPQRALALDSLVPVGALREELSALQRMHPFYKQLLQGFVAYHQRWGRLPQIPLPLSAGLRAVEHEAAVALLRQRLGLGPTPAAFDAALADRLSAFQSVHGLDPTGVADAATISALNAGSAHYEAIIRANIERTRALPPNPGARYILVNVPAARLWLYEDGKVIDTMRVLVGKPNLPTPLLAGLIRYAALNPYWNMPPDLIRDRLAPHVLHEGPGYVRAQRYELLTDYSPAARLLEPTDVDWSAVAAGHQVIRARQLPGPHNMMGRIKFMLPNPLGIYLHDTPEKALFAGDDRAASSGCIRIEDAPRLARWLFRGHTAAPNGAAEQRVDLPEPVPVYVVYLTALPGPAGITFQRDIYGKDEALIAALDDRQEGGPT